MPEIRINDFDYGLPEEKIAQSAAEPRDSSKLLHYRKGDIADHVFRDLPDLIPSGATLFFNDAKVIPARILLKNSTGARIEVFLLQPHAADYFTAINARHTVEWTCLVGKRKKWKPGEVLEANVGEVRLQVRQENEQVVRFSWNGEWPFLHVLEHLGKMPLPPYIKHESGEDDRVRYQTVYSRTPGSVAAPTAGLHFTADVFSRLKDHQVDSQYLTLHVSAGTFLPVKTENALEHVMHTEMFSVRKETLESMSEAKHIIAVGTTSCRVLESLYWCGVNILRKDREPFRIPQFPSADAMPESNEALRALIGYCHANQLDEIQGETSIMITPGYRFRFIKGLVTNFHQPKSTLLLLIAAFIGENWKKVYQHALAENYRFLSYGDSSFLEP